MKYSITFFLSLIVIAVSGQQTWSLDECISYAIFNNLELRDLKYGEAIAKEVQDQANRELFPTVQVDINYNMNFGRNVDPISNSFTTSSYFGNTYILSTSIDVFRGFQKRNLIKASELMEKAVKEDIKQEKFMLAFRVMSAFYDIRFYSKLVEQSKVQLEIAKENYNFIKRKVELGQLAKADIYEAESIVASDEFTLAQSVNQWKDSQLLLIHEMNLLNTSEIKLKDEEIVYINDTYGVPQETVYNNAVSFVPVIKSSEFQISAVKSEIEAAKGNLYPYLSVDAAVGAGYFETLVDSENKTISFLDQIEETARGRFGVNLTIPIFNAGREKSIINQKQIEFEKSVNTLNSQKQALYKIIQDLIQSQIALEKELDLSTKKVESQEIAFDIAQRKYKRGIISLLDMHRAKNVMAKAYNENLLVEMNLNVNKATLDFYNGNPFFSDLIIE